MTTFDASNEKLHVPAQRMISVPWTGFWVAVVAFTLCVLLAGFGIGYSIGHDAACATAYRGLFQTSAQITEGEYQQAKRDCLSAR